MEQEEAVIAEPPERATASIIWLHGLGADGHDFEPIVPQLSFPSARATRFVFPHAPHQAVTVNGGMVMRAWYDIRDAQLPGYVDEAGIRRSQERLTAYVDRELAHGIDAERIVLAGFSQGGVIALRTGLAFEPRVGAILALSTYLPMSKSSELETEPGGRTIPVFMAHGSADPLIPMSAAEESRDRLLTMGYSVEWHDYPMQHEMCLEEIRDIGKWLSAILG